MAAFANMMAAAQKPEVMIMFDDFMVRALLAGIGLALVAGPLGCFVIWRQMAFFGETMAHSALLGIALSLLLDFNALWGVLAITVLIAIALPVLSKAGGGKGLLSNDALLGILSHSALALGLVVIGLMTWVRVDVMALLVGDVLAVSRTDLIVIYGGGAAILALLVYYWRDLLMATVSVDIAKAEEMNPDRSQMVLMLVLAVIIAIAMKIVGVLLITALLIIPASAARRFASTPEQMAMISAGLGSVAVVGGLSGSLQFDTMPGPSIVVAALLIFMVSVLARQRRKGQGNEGQ